MSQGYTTIDEWKVFSGAFEQFSEMVTSWYCPQFQQLGHLQEHHRFMLETLLDQVEFLEQQMARLDERMEAQMRPFEAAINRVETIDGIDRWGAQCLLAELGPDMAQYPSADHLSSWAGMSPGNDESAGKRRSDKTPKSSTCSATGKETGDRGAGSYDPGRGLSHVERRGGLSRCGLGLL